MSKNSKSLDSFVKYCEANPEQRFWQALRNWSGWNFILVSNDPISKGEGVSGALPLSDFRDTWEWADL